MATGGSLPSTSSFSLPPPVKAPTESHENLHHGGKADHMARPDSSDAIEEDCVGSQLELADDMAEQDSFYDSEEDYFKSELEVLSKIIDQIMTENAKEVRERYFKDIKGLIGNIVHDDAGINDWMDDLDFELTADANDGSIDNNLDDADDLRNQLSNLNDLAVLFITAPVVTKCPEPEELEASATHKVCKSLLADTNTGNRLVVISCHKQTGQKKPFRKIEYTLNKSRLAAILKDPAFKEYEEIPESEDLVKINKWKLVVLHVRKSKNTDQNDKVWRLGWRSHGSMDLFRHMCDELNKFYSDFEKDKSRRRLLAEDYIKCLKVTEGPKVKVDFAAVACVAEIESGIATFMLKHGTKSKMVLVLYNGHGYENGDLRLHSPHPAKQMTILNAISKSWRKPIPRSIDMVWICCHSYMGVNEQKNNADPHINVIERYMWNKGNYDFWPREGSLYSFHLTCKENRLTSSMTTITRKTEGRGNITAAYSSQAREFADEQNRKAYGTRYERSSSNAIAESSSGENTRQPPATLTDDLPDEVAKMQLEGAPTD